MMSSDEWDRVSTAAAACGGAVEDGIAWTAEEESPPLVPLLLEPDVDTTGAAAADAAGVEEAPCTAASFGCAASE